MRALELTSTWPVGRVSAAAVTLLHDGSTPAVSTIGDAAQLYRLASLAKPISAWAMLIAVEEGLIALDTPVGQPGCTLAHLLAHAGGYAFDGADPIAAPGKRRIYSNTGIELAADAVATAAAMPFEQYLREALLEPLGMTATELRGSPAHALWSTVDDVVRFAIEAMAPTLLAASTAAAATTPYLPTLAGLVPGIGRFDPCPWGLGFEIRGTKQPHWTGTRNSPDTFGHFGGAGTLLWIDPTAYADRQVACIALTDRAFDEWQADALRLWPEFGDAVLAEAGQTPVPPTDLGDDAMARR